MCKNQRPVFVCALYWVTGKNVVGKHQFDIHYNGELTDIDDLFNFLVKDREVIKLGRLDIPEGSNVRIVVGTFCSNCWGDISFKSHFSFDLYSELEDFENLIPADEVESMYNLSPVSFLFVHLLLESLTERISLGDPIDDVRPVLEIGARNWPSFNSPELN